MSFVVDQFLRYISYDTQSVDEAEKIPSTESQFALANLLAKELEEMGAEEVKVDCQCYGVHCPYGYGAGVFGQQCETADH